MTDHIADASKKVEPCAWCRREPTEHIGDYDCTCFLGSMCDRAGLDGWNDTQRRIMEQRREDFNAGRWIEQGCGFVFTDFDHYMRHAHELKERGRQSEY